MHVAKFHPLPIRIDLLLLLALTFLGTGTLARAQADATASRIAEVSAFVGFTHSNPDYGSARNSGFTAGADYTRFFHWRIVPSFEVRANYTTGLDMNQETALAGLRLHTDFHRFHPYADALIGATRITFAVPPAPGYIHDTAGATSFGGGVNIDLIRSFQAKVDFQEQFENFGPNGTLPGNANFTLSPTLLTVGVVYRLPSGFRRARSK